MKFTEDILLSYVLNFISTITLLLCFKWCREYLPFTVTVAIALVLSLPIELKKIENNYFFELIIVSLRSMLLALPLAFAIEALPFAGRLIDLARGMQFAEINFGQNNQRNSILESLFDFFATVLFFKHHLFLVLLEKYFSAFNCNFDLLSVVVICSKSFFYGLLIAAPVLVLCFSIDLMSSLISRILLRSNLDLSAAKALAGLVAVYLGIDYYFEVFLTWLNPFLLPSVS